MEDEKEVETIEDKKEIEKIINEKIKNKEINLTQNYRIRTAMRDISDEKVMEIFPQFDKVFAIEKKVLKYGDVGYELFYKLSNNVTFSIATCPKEKKIDFIHAIEYKRSLAKRFKMK